MANKKIPTYLTDEQRQVMMEIPADLSDRDLARYYTFTSEELELVNRRRRPANRFGFALQLALLHFPGHPPMPPCGQAWMSADRSSTAICLVARSPTKPL
jgi:Domain of unknown function (DUF4158)